MAQSRTTLPRRTRMRGRSDLDRHDALPPELRRWAAEAALPWSASSCLKIWQRVHAKGGTAEDALRTLTACEAQTLARDRPALDGPDGRGAVTRR